MRTLTVSTAVIAGALAMGCSTGGAPSQAPAVPSGASVASTSPTASTPSSSQTAGIDRAFIDMMVPHHQSAIEMAKLARDKAQHQELRGLADTIMNAQQSEIVELKDWRASWFGSDVTPPMSAMPLMPGMNAAMGGHQMTGTTMDMTADLEKLRIAEPFDRAFLDAMTAHHESALEAAKIVLAQSARPELRGLAEAIIKSQRAEIDQMKDWRATWYPGG